MIDYLQDRFPDLLKNIRYTHPCYFTMPKTKDFEYKTDQEGIHYAYAFGGTGFKFMPLHGKIVHDGLITKKDQTYIPLRYRAKI